jgi:hypothetical protein
LSSTCTEDWAGLCRESTKEERINKFHDEVFESLMAFSFYKVAEDEKLFAIADGALKCFLFHYYVVIISWLNCNLKYRVMVIARDSIKNMRRNMSQAS